MWYHPRVSRISKLLPTIRQLHDLIRSRVLAALEAYTIEELSHVVAHQGGDVVFALDRVSEEVLVDYVDREIACQDPIVLIAEGLPDGKMVMPAGANEDDCLLKMIVDPIDGSRPLMFQKRSGWILTGIAPNRGESTGLRDICLAVQTEIPLFKQHLSDQLWAIRGQETKAVRYNRLTQESTSFDFQPTSAQTIQSGFASISRFFPGQRDVLAGIEEDIVRKALGQLPPGSTTTFEDQYPSTGGQLYGLLSGADRFLADLRPLMKKVANERGELSGNCCHPYDICTLLIAEQLGVMITDVEGGPLDVPLDVETPVTWAGYANEHIRKQIEPILHQVLTERHLL